MFSPFTFEDPNNSHKETTTVVLETLFQKPNKTSLSQAEINTKNNIIGGIVKRVKNDKSSSKNNKMLYVYYQKLLQDCENILLWINKKIQYQVKFFENKCASVFVTASVTDIFITENSVTASVPNHFSFTASVPSANPVTASVTTDNLITSYVSTYNYITAFVPTYYTVTASVPAANPFTASVTTSNPFFFN